MAIQVLIPPVLSALVPTVLSLLSLALLLLLCVIRKKRRLEGTYRPSAEERKQTGAAGSEKPGLPLPLPKEERLIWWSVPNRSHTRSSWPLGWCMLGFFFLHQDSSDSLNSVCAAPFGFLVTTNRLIYISPKNMSQSSFCHIHLVWKSRVPHRGHELKHILYLYRSVFTAPCIIFIYKSCFTPLWRILIKTLIMHFYFELWPLKKNQKKPQVWMIQRLINQGFTHPVPRDFLSFKVEKACSDI